MQVGGTNERLTRDFVRSTWQEPSALDFTETAMVENSVEAALQATISSISIGGLGGDCKAITWEAVVMESATDQEIRQLVYMVRSGIPDIKELSSQVIFREVLDVLHAAHQGCSSMEARASQSVWWPGLKDKIAKRRLFVRVA